MKADYDVIVVGGGAIGLATAYELGKRGVKTLVLEKFNFGNQNGSSAGVSRQYRIPYPDDYMVKMAMESQRYWDALQKETEVPLMDKVGTLWFGDPSVHSTEGNIREAEIAMTANQVEYEKLDCAQIEERFHFKNLPKDYVGIFQKDGASINFRATIHLLFTLCQKFDHVDLKAQSDVTKITPVDDGFEVLVGNERVTSKKLVLTPGPYINEVLNLLNFEVSVRYWTMSSAYFKKRDPSIQYPTWFVFQNAVGESGNQFYGFPSVDWDHGDYIRVAPDFVLKETEDPSKRTFEPNLEELELTSQWVENHMKGLNPIPELTTTCFIALSSDDKKEMLIDFALPQVPRNRDIVICATGWAAKFTPFLGEILADLATKGQTDFDISEFQIGHRLFSMSY